MRIPTWIYFLVFVGLLIGNVKVHQTIFAEPLLTVSVLEAGKGHVILIRSPSRKTILIDTGPDASILRALGNALPIWQRKINIVILTSSAARSAGGLSAVPSRYHLSKIIRIGDAPPPYGPSFLFDNSRITILAPATLSISSDSNIFSISSSTPSGIYTSNGETIAKCSDEPCEIWLKNDVF